VHRRGSYVERASCCIPGANRSNSCGNNHRVGVRADSHGEHLADDDHVIAGLVFSGLAADEGRDCRPYQRQSMLALDELVALELVHTAGREPLRERFSPAGRMLTAKCSAALNAS